MFCFLLCVVCCLLFVVCCAFLFDRCLSAVCPLRVFSAARRRLGGGEKSVAAAPAVWRLGLGGAAEVAGHPPPRRPTPGGPLHYAGRKIAMVHTKSNFGTRSYAANRDALCNGTGCIMQLPPCIMQLAKGVQLPPVRVWQANLTHYAKSGCSSTVNLIEPPDAFLKQYVDFLQN